MPRTQLSYLATLGGCLVPLLASAEAIDDLQLSISALEPGNASSHLHLIKRYSSYMDQYRRAFRRGSKEYERRLALFSRRAAEVEELNQRPHRLWSAGLNSMSDRTEVELSQLRGWKGVTTKAAGDGAGRIASPRDRGGAFLRQRVQGEMLPTEFANWTRLETLETIENQGSCGSCWAITSTTVLNAHAEIYGGSSFAQRGAGRTLRRFSTQELLNCVPNPHSCGGEGGCDGATVELAFNWAMRHGLTSEDEEPYRAVTTQCRGTLEEDALKAIQARTFTRGGLPARTASSEDEDDTDKIIAPGAHSARKDDRGLGFGLRGWERLPENRYEPLLRALVQKGPVAVSVAASTWFAYAAGIFDHCDKDSIIDHAVTLIGFGKDPELEEKYWLIQNSWGDDWGEEGRMRILRRDGTWDETEQCGTDNQPELGTGCEGGPRKVKVCGMCGILYDSVVPYFGHSSMKHF